jgi:hypothetical protein
MRIHLSLGPHAVGQDLSAPLQVAPQTKNSDGRNVTRSPSMVKAQITYLNAALCRSGASRAARWLEASLAWPRRTRNFKASDSAWLTPRFPIVRRRRL